jgi:fibronectin-binding autotransporter adhesin
MKREWTRTLRAVLVPALLLGGGGSASAAVTTSIWADGNSNWNNAANWNPAQVPNNNATDQFVAIINNGSTVTVDISPTVNVLAIDFFAPPASSLLIGNGQALTIASGGLLLNTNVIGVNAPGTGVLVLDSATNINAGTFLASGGGRFEVNGAGQTIDNSSGTITALNGSSVVLFGFGTTVSGGTLATAGTGVVAMSGFLVNLSGVTNTGTFAIPGTSVPASVLGITGTSTNTGTMGVFEPGKGVILLGSTLHNTGTLLASGGGTLEVNGAGHTLDNSSGTIRALDGSRVVISGFGTTVSGGTLSTAGTGVVGMSGFLVNLSGVTNTGTFAIPGTSVPASVLGITGTSTNAGTMGIFEPGEGVILLGSTLHNTGTLLASGGGTLEVNGAGHTLDNSSGTIRALDGSRVVISGFGTTVSGGTLSTAGTGVVAMAGFLVNLSGVTNTGTFAIPGNSSPASVLGITGTSTNAGTMGIFEPGKGVILIQSGTLNNTGTLQASGGGNLQFNGGTINNSSGAITALNGSLVTLFNGATVSGGTIATAGTGVVEVFAGAMANLNGVTNTGTFSVPDKATLFITGTSTNTGTMGTFAPGTGVVALLPGRVLNNAGTLQASGGGTFEVNMGGGGTINNTGTLQAIGGSRLEVFNGGTVTNSGTFFVDAGSRLVFSGVPSVTNSGTVSIASGGTLEASNYVQTAGVTNVNGVLSAAPALVDIRGGTLSGAGAVVGDVKNGGTVAPGNSPGILLVTGNYTQTSAGILDIEIGGLTAGSGYDQLRVLGDAFIAGMLEVDLVNGFAPTTDAFFDILVTGFFSPGSVSGTFDTVDLPTLSTGTWAVSYLPDRVRVTFAFVPEPSSLVLLGVGLVLMAFRRSKTRAPLRDIENVPAGTFCIMCGRWRRAAYRNVGN